MKPENLKGNWETQSLQKEIMRECSLKSKNKMQLKVITHTGRKQSRRKKIRWIAVWNFYSGSAQMFDCAWKSISSFPGQSRYKSSRRFWKFVKSFRLAKYGVK
jgi:hypothetical protein